VTPPGCGRALHTHHPPPFAACVAPQPLGVGSTLSCRPRLAAQCAKSGAQAAPIRGGGVIRVQMRGKGCPCMC
jgi:hypothetical protein